MEMTVKTTVVQCVVTRTIAIKQQENALEDAKLDGRDFFASKVKYT